MVLSGVYGDGQAQKCKEAVAREGMQASVSVLVVRSCGRTQTSRERRRLRAFRWDRDAAEKAVRDSGCADRAPTDESTGEGAVLSIQSTTHYNFPVSSLLYKENMAFLYKEIWKHQEEKGLRDVFEIISNN